MEFTKITTIHWSTMEHQAHHAIAVARNTKLAEMHDQGKTDQDVYSRPDEHITVRPWIDQASAEEFVSFITEQAATNGCTIISATIGDYIDPTEPVND